MRIPKILEKQILESEAVKAKVEKEISRAVSEALLEARKEWSVETAEAIKDRIEKKRNYVLARPYDNQESFTAREYNAGQNYSTLTTLFTDAPGSIQCASRIRDGVLGGGYVIKEEQGGEGKKDDMKKLIAFFDSPNPEETIEMLLGTAIENYLAYGNFYWEKVPTKGTIGKDDFVVAELYNLDPVKMKILIDDEKKKKGVLEKIGYKRETDQNKAVIYKTIDVFHGLKPSRRADLYGRAVLEDNVASLQLILRALTYNINILKNGGRPPIQLVLPADSTESDADAVNSFFEKNFMGPQNAGKPLVTFKGAEAKSLGVTPEEMAYLELLMFGLKLVAGQYGVPLPLVGFPEGSNRAIMAEMRRSFYLTVVFPLRKYLSQRITNEIIKKGMGIEGLRIDFKSTGLEESEASRRDFQKIWSSGLYTFNETRIAMGQLPIDEKWANEYYLLGTKNDSLIPIKDAIGRVSDTSSPDKPVKEPQSEPGEHSPANDDQTHDDDKEPKKST